MAISRFLVALPVLAAVSLFSVQAAAAPCKHKVSITVKGSSLEGQIDLLKYIPEDSRTMPPYVVLQPGTKVKLLGEYRTVLANDGNLYNFHKVRTSSGQVGYIGDIDLNFNNSKVISDPWEQAVIQKIQNSQFQRELNIGRQMADFEDESMRARRDGGVAGSWAYPDR